MALRVFYAYKKLDMCQYARRNLHGQYDYEEYDKRKARRESEEEKVEIQSNKRAGKPETRKKRRKTGF